MFSVMERCTDMPFDLVAMAAEFDEMGISPDEYATRAASTLGDWLTGASASPMAWLAFGPWWGFVQKQLPNIDTSRWAGGDAPPDELSHYTEFDPAYLGLFAAMQNINRHGGMVSLMNEPQSIVLADGRNALYSPETGILEDE